MNLRFFFLNLQLDPSYIRHKRVPSTSGWKLKTSNPGDMNIMNFLYDILSVFDKIRNE